MKVWITGRFIMSVDTHVAWEFNGVFDSEEKADAACLYDNDYYFPTEMDHSFATVNGEIVKGVVYPRVSKEPVS